MAVKETNRRHFAVFVAILTGRRRDRAMRTLAIDSPDAHAAASLLKGNDAVRSWFLPDRLDAAMSYAEDVGLLTV